MNSQSVTGMAMQKIRYTRRVLSSVSCPLSSVRHAIRTGLLALLLFPWLPGGAPAALEAETRDTVGETATAEFSYEVEGRHDPFMPFLTVKSSRDDEIVDEEGGELTGLRRLEPRQLTLVAILRAGDAFIAMAQDDTGIGYTLREGMRIGRRGLIEQINSTEVRIRETSRTRGGREVVQNIVMGFNKDGVK